MKMFSDCSGECCVCAMGAGRCLAGHGDDDYSPATKEEIIRRLDEGLYKGQRRTMKHYLSLIHHYDYDAEKSKRENYN